MTHFLAVPCPFEGCTATLNVQATTEVRTDRKGRNDVVLTIVGLTDTARTHLYGEHDDFDMFIVETT